MECGLCAAKECITVGEQGLCLQHFSSNLLDGCDAPPLVSDEGELARQTGDVKNLWTEAITDVVLRMFALQKKEEEALRKDPLSILSMNKSKSSKVLKRKFGDHSLLQTSQSTTTKRPALPTGAAPFPTAGGGRLLHMTNDSFREMEEREAREREAADGDACSSCGSKWTFRAPRMGFDISKAEVWGSRHDEAEIFSITCKSCLHVQISR